MLRAPALTLGPLVPRLSVLSACALLAVACAPKSPTVRPSESAQSVAAPPGASDALAVSGLRGTLSQHEIKAALDPRLPKFLRCLQARLGEVELISGTISLAFVVASNGSVASVQPSASSLGDRATERCMVEVARATRFPAPHGGDAEFSWPLEVPLDPELRAPVPLGPDAARKLLADEGPALHARCGGGQSVVTAYVDPEGHVLAAGAASPDPATESQLDCLVDGVRALQFDSPGSYVGKLSFSLP